MKRIILLLALFSIMGCTKEKQPDSLLGSWRLMQINSGDTSTVYLTGTEFSVDFKSDGRFDILGPKPNYSFLQEFNRYETVNFDRIRFYDSTSTEELFANFQIENSLSLSYEFRCPYEEKFTRR
jgi:hypothetical protein